MSKTREPGQGAEEVSAEGLPATTNIYAPPAAALDTRRLQPTIPIYLLLGFVVAVVLLLASLMSWLTVGLPYFLPLIDADDLPPQAWLMISYVDLLSSPLLTSTSFALATGMAIWQGCTFASLRRAYGEDIVKREWSSGVWWLFPGADLVVPVRCLRDLRHLVQKPRDRPDPKAPFGRTLVFLEALLISEFLLSMTSWLMATFSETTDEEIAADEEAVEEMITSAAEITPEVILSLVHCSVGAALSVTALVIVITYFYRQKELYAHWQDDLYWESRERLMRKRR